jgi:hypothetical protein
MVTASTSPASAPFTKSGPVSGCTRLRFAAATSAGAELRVNWWSKASRVTNTTVSPGSAVAAGLMAGCQRLWQAESSAHLAPVLGIRTVLAKAGSTSDAKVNVKATRASRESHREVRAMVSLLFRREDARLLGSPYGSGYLNLAAAALQVGRRSARAPACI